MPHLTHEKDLLLLIVMINNDKDNDRLRKYRVKRAKKETP